MKKLIFLLLPLLAMRMAAQITPDTRLTLHPEKPEAGKTVQVSFDLSSTPLSGKTVGAEVLQMEEKGMKTMELALTQNGNTVTGAIPVNTGARMLLLNFYADNNGKEINETALAPLYDAGGNLLADCRAIMANVLSGQTFIPDIQVKNDLAKAMACFEAEMATNPEAKNKYLINYLNLKLKVTKLEGREQMIKDLDDFVTGNKQLHSYQLNQVKKLYEKLKSPEKAAEMNAAIKTAGEKEKTNSMKAFFEKLNKEKDAAKAMQLVENFIKEQPKENRGMETYSWYYGMVIQKAANSNNWKLVDKASQVLMTTGRMSDKETLAGEYNSIAWKMSGESLDAKPVNLAKGLTLAKKSVELYTEMINNISEKDIPPFSTPRRRKKELERGRGMVADTYALLLFKSGDLANALKYQQMATDAYSEADVNERLIVYMAKKNGNASVMQKAEEMAKEGNASQKVMDMLKEAWTAKNGAAGWDAYLADLQKAYKAKMKEEWKLKLENYAAPKFALKDLEGKEVSLESLAGKVVVVDFWATWCGPCRASFPGMQKAQAVYKNDPDVKFVFVDTWENKKPEETNKLVGDFITKNKYPFHVLMDYENQVVEKFEVSGIPAKFIIDQQGNIRFRATGFSGTDQKVVDEMTTMIDILKEQR